ncbi:hypothetical protein [Halolamina pelagica]|uniref:hypothetical protein n=1 Tax=Halolamina pelagica TaxID=699431 RepID=UPI0006CA69F4|nr:hypothetical protein [Halolamina pelagica]
MVDDRRLDVTFADADRAVVPRALTVPILPKHVWRDRTDAAAIGGIPVGTVTEALVSNNIPPIGSGPFAYVRNTPASASGSNTSRGTSRLGRRPTSPTGSPSPRSTRSRCRSSAPT